MESILNVVGSLSGGPTGCFLVELAFRLTLVAGFGLLALALLRGASAGIRHLVAVSTLAALLGLPLVAALLPAWNLPILPRPTVASASPATHRPAISGERRAHAPSLLLDGWRIGDNAPDLGAPGSAARSARVAPDRDPVAPRPLAIPATLLPLIALLLALGVAEALLLRVAFSCFAAGRIARRAPDVAADEPRRAFESARERMRVRRPVSLRSTRRVAMPVIAGLRRPALLLPVEALGWRLDELRLVFLHELAHVRRNDMATLLLSRIATAVYWFHPLVWILAREARRDCERACDDLVLASGVRPSDYAERMLSIAGSARRAEGFAGTVLAFARPSTLERRLASILRPDARRAPASARAAVACGVAALLMVAGLGTVRVVSASGDRATARVPARPIESANPGPERAASATPAPAPILAPAPEPSSAPPDAPEFRFLEKKQTLTRESSAEWTRTVTAGIPAIPAAGPGWKIKRADGDSWFDRGRQLYKDERYEEAAEAYRRAAEAGTRVGTALYNAGCCYALLHQKEDALDALSEALDAGFDGSEYFATDSDLNSLRSDRRFRELLDRSGATEVAERKRGSALEDYESLRASGSTNAGAWKEAGLDLMRSGETRRAAEAFRTQNEIEPSSNALYNMACAYALGDEKDKALEALERSILAGYGDAEHMAEDTDLASLHADPRFDRLVELTDDLTLFTHGRGDDDRAAWRSSISNFEKVTRDYPKVGRAWFNLGYAQLRVRDPRASYRSFQRALDLDYRPPTTMYNLACASAQMGDLDGAFQWLDKADKAGFGVAMHAAWDQDLRPLRSDSRFRRRLMRWTRDGVLEKLEDKIGVETKD